MRINAYIGSHLNFLTVASLNIPEYPPLDTLFEGTPEPKRQKTSESIRAESSSLSSPSSSSVQCAESEAAYKDTDSCFIGLFM